MQLSPEQEDQITKVFFPHMFAERARIEKEKKRFVHYTNADAAMQILRNKEIWMRNASCMNDFMEVEHGFQCLNESYKGSKGTILKEALNNLYEGLSADLEKLFNTWLDSIKYPWVMRQAFVELLSDAGVKDAEQRVFVSDIPLRK